MNKKYLEIHAIIICKIKRCICIGVIQICSSVRCILYNYIPLTHGIPIKFKCIILYY